MGDVCGAICAGLCSSIIEALLWPCMTTRNNCNALSCGSCSRCPCFGPRSSSNNRFAYTPEDYAADVAAEKKDVPRIVELVAEPVAEYGGVRMAVIPPRQ